MLIKSTAVKRGVDEYQREIFRETNKLMGEFKNNCLIREFVHDCNKKMGESIFSSKIHQPYLIDDKLYTDKDIRDFLFIFIPRFPFHMYKQYKVFNPENGKFKISFQIGSSSRLINFTIRDETAEEDGYPIMNGLFRRL